MALKPLGPLTITPRVQREQERGGPPAYSAALRKAAHDGWILVVQPPTDLETAQLMAWSRNLLSATDAELLAWAKRHRCLLLTNDGDLIRACTKLGVEAIDLVQTLVILRENGHVDDAMLARIVSDIAYHDNKRFTPAQLEALGLPVG